MLTNRSRSYTSYDPGTQVWAESDVQSREDNGGGYCSGPFHSKLLSEVQRAVPLRYSTGTIWDYKAPHYKQKNPNYRHPRMVPRRVNDVYHTKVALMSFNGTGSGDKVPEQDNILFEYWKDMSTSECDHERTVAFSCSPLAYLCRRYGSEYVRTQIFPGLQATHPGGVTFASADWAPIADEFDERTKQLVPSSFFLGETMYESSIFKTALLTVANPSRAIGRFVKDVQRRGLHRLNLGKIAHYYRNRESKVSHLRSAKSIIAAADRSAKLLSDRGVASRLHRIQDISTYKSVLKEGINSHLSYTFGVKPAIKDIGDMLAAHSEVEKRLAYLNEHRGQYIPIRASRKIPATFTPGDRSASAYYLEFDSVLRDAYTKLVIFGLGRIRDDIHEASRWRAYTEYFGLNKVIGIGWELIPFSFVADWFVNAQEFVNSKTRIPLGESPFLNLASIGHSVKNVSTFDYLCRPGYDPSNMMSLVTPSDPFPIFTYSVSDYTRVSGFPSTSLFDNPSSFGLFRGSIGIELLLQKSL